MKTRKSKTKLHVLVATLFTLGSCGRPASPPGTGHHAESKSSKGWVSSGGDRLLDSLNPWWLKNTSQVHYCVDLDPTAFSISKKDAERITADALAFWQLEFQGSTIGLSPTAFEKLRFNKLGVAIQNFIAGPCTHLTDLQIKLGPNALTPEQKAFVDSTTPHLGLAVRTEYDEVNLHGRGFIFIDSDFKPLGYSPNPKQQFRITLKRFADRQVLFFHLVHELGHVFGLPHSAANRYLMGQRFPELLTWSHDPYRRPVRLLSPAELPSFFFPRRNHSSVSSNSTMALAFPPEAPEFRTYFGLVAPDWVKSNHFVDVKSVHPETIDLALKGHEENISLGRLTFNLTAKVTPLVVVHLTSKQTVFAPAEIENGIVFGPGKVSLQGAARFRSSSTGAEKVSAVTWSAFDEGGIHVSSEIENELHTIFKSTNSGLLE